jgi:hypothetical protein
MPQANANATERPFWKQGRPRALQIPCCLQEIRPWRPLNTTQIGATLSVRFSISPRSWA